MKKKSSFSFAARIRSFGYAINGIFTVFKTQHNAWIHLVATLVVIMLGAWFGLTNIEWCLIGIAITLVLIAEMFNTAIEMIMDKISPERSEETGKIKDIAAGAVLVAASVAVVIGALVFVPKIWRIIS